MILGQLRIGARSTTYAALICDFLQNMSLYPLQAHPDQQNMPLYPLQVHAQSLDGQSVEAHKAILL